MPFTKFNKVFYHLSFSISFDQTMLWSVAAKPHAHTQISNKRFKNTTRTIRNYWLLYNWVQHKRSQVSKSIMNFIMPPTNKTANSAIKSMLNTERSTTPITTRRQTQQRFLIPEGKSIPKFLCR